MLGFDEAMEEFGRVLEVMEVGCGFLDCGEPAVGYAEPAPDDPVGICTFHRAELVLIGVQVFSISIETP